MAAVGRNAVKERHGTTTINMTLQVHGKRSDADAWATTLQEIASLLNSKVPAGAAQLGLLIPRVSKTVWPMGTMVRQAIPWLPSSQLQNHFPSLGSTDPNPYGHNPSGHRPSSNSSCSRSMSHHTTNPTCSNRPNSPSSRPGCASCPCRLPDLCELTLAARRWGL